MVEAQSLPHPESLRDVNDPSDLAAAQAEDAG